MKYNVTFYYCGSITHTVEAADKDEAYKKMRTYTNSLTDDQFLREVELNGNGSDIEEVIEEAGDDDEVDIDI